MVFELRHYVAHPDKAGILRHRFAESAVPLLERHGMRVVGVWQEEGQPDSFWYLLEFPEGASRDAAWHGFREDPDWQAAKATSEAGGPLVRRFECMTLAPVQIGIMENHS